jgi:hypothetical protein
MGDETVYEQGRGYASGGIIRQALVWVARLYPVPPTSATPLLVAGVGCSARWAMRCCALRAHRV